MIKIVLIQFTTAIACYFLGVFIGKRSVLRDGERNDRPDNIEIQHVGYDAEQCGREK